MNSAVGSEHPRASRVWAIIGSLWLTGCATPPTIDVHVVRFDARELVVDVRTTPGAAVTVGSVTTTADDTGLARATLSPTATSYEDLPEGPDGSRGLAVPVNVEVDALLDKAGTSGVVRLPYGLSEALALDSAEAIAVASRPGGDVAIAVVGDLATRPGTARIVAAHIELGLIGPRGTTVTVGGASVALAEGFPGDPLDAPLAQATLRVPLALVLAELPAAALSGIEQTTMTLEARVGRPSRPETKATIGFAIEANDLPPIVVTVLAAVARGPAPWVARPTPAVGLAVAIDLGPDIGLPPLAAIFGVATLAEVASSACSARPRRPSRARSMGSRSA